MHDLIIDSNYDGQTVFLGVWTVQPYGHGYRKQRVTFYFSRGIKTGEKRTMSNKIFKDIKLLRHTTTPDLSSDVALLVCCVFDVFFSISKVTEFNGDR